MAGGGILGSWSVPITAIYMYGPSAEKMNAALEPLLCEYPLCRDARMVMIHGKPVLTPRTMLLPIHV